MNKKDTVKQFKKGTVVMHNSAECEVVDYYEVSKANWGLVVKMGNGDEVQTETENVSKVVPVKLLTAEKTSKKLSKDMLDKTTKVLAKQIAENIGALAVDLAGDGQDVVVTAIAAYNEKGEALPLAVEAVVLEPVSVDTTALDKELEECDSVAAQIRVLLKRGVGRSQVAKQLNVGYRYVYAIEHKILKRELPYIILPNEPKS